MTLADDKWVILILEEHNENNDNLDEERPITHVVSNEAFRYPKPYDGDLYLVGFDKQKNIHFFLVETKDDGTLLRGIDDEELFNKLLRYYENPDRLPTTEEDERLKQKIFKSFNQNNKFNQLPLGETI